MTEVGKVSIAIEGDSSKLQDAAKKGASAVSQMASAASASGKTLGQALEGIGGSGAAGFAAFGAGVLVAELAINAFMLAGRALIGLVSGIGAAFGASLKDAMAWEEAFANVKKVLGDDATSAATSKLEEDLIALSTRIPVAATELAKFAQIGAQMGMHQSELADFAETIARITTSFDGATAEKAALSLGKMRGQLQMTMSEMRNFASAIMLVGAKMETTEAQVIQVAEKFAGMAHIVGLTNAQVVAYAATAASLNNRYAESGTAIFRMMQTFKTAVEEGGKKAETFARTIGLPVEEFRRLAKENPSKVFDQFSLSLGGTDKHAVNTTKTLRELGFTGRTTGGIWIAMANDSAKLQKALKLANEEIERGMFIQEASNLRWDTATQKIKLLTNSVTAASIEFGRTFLPSLNAILAALQPLGHALFVTGDAFRMAFQRDLTDTVRPMAGYLKDVAVGVDLVALAVHALAVEHGKKGEVKLFWETFGTGIKLAAEAALMHVPVLREAVTLIQALHAVGAAKGEEGSGLTSTATLHAPPGFKTPAQIAEEKAATDAILKMQEKLREELDKLGDTNRTVYEKMIADIDRATQKRLLEAQVTAKDNVGALRSMEAVIRDIDMAAKAAANQQFFEKIFGGLTDAEKQMVDLGQALQALQKKGLEPTTEQLLFAHDAIRLFGDAGADSLAKIETAAPGAVEQLERVYYATKKLFELKDVPIGKLPNITLPKNVPSLAGGIHFDKPDVQVFKDEVSLFKDLQQEAQAYQNKLKDIQGEHKAWASALKTLDSLYQLLGVKSDSFLGRQLAGLVGTNEALSQLELGFARQFSKVDEATGKFKDFKFDTQGAIEMAQAVVKIALAFKQATDSANKWERALNGGLIGAQVGAKIGTMVQPGTGTLVGAVVGAIVGAAVGFFKAPSWAKVGEEAGDVLGTAIGRQMAQAIEKTSKELDVTVATAALLHLTEVISQSGKSVESFSTEIGTLMYRTMTGAVPAVQGIKQIGDAFGMAKTEALQSGEMINRTMLGMIVNARALGLEVEAISAHIKENLNRAIGGVNTLFKPVSTQEDDKKPGIKLAINSEADAKAAAAIFSATFWGAVKEFGLIGAVDALKVPFDNLIAVLTAGGYDIGKLFGDVIQFFDFAANDAFRGAAEGAVALREGLIGLANAGMLTQEAFHGFGHAAVQAFEQAKEASGSEKAGIMAVAPVLAELQRAHDLYGYQLTDEEQKLMDIATANGLAFPKDPILQVRDAIYDLIEAITGIPRDVQINIHTNRTTTNTNSHGNPKIDRDQDGYDDETGEPMARGGLVESTPGGVHVVLAEGGEDEFVVPASKAKAFAAQAGGGDSTSSAAILAELRNLNKRLSRMPSENARAIRDAMMLAA